MVLSIAEFWNALVEIEKLKFKNIPLKFIGHSLKKIMEVRQINILGGGKKWNIGFLGVRGGGI